MKRTALPVEKKEGEILVGFFACSITVTGILFITLWVSLHLFILPTMRQCPFQVQYQMFFFFWIFILQSDLGAFRVRKWFLFRNLPLF